MAIYSGFSHWKWWFSIVMLVYQRVNPLVVEDSYWTWTVAWFFFRTTILIKSNECDVWVSISWRSLWMTFQKGQHRRRLGQGLGSSSPLPSHFCQIIFAKITASCSGIKLCYKICSSKTRIPDIEISAKFKPLTRPECDWWVVFGKNPNPNFMKSHG